MHERNGVQWRYVDGDDVHRGVHVCTECDRAFVASCHRQRAGEHWCPDCREVEGLGVAVGRGIETADPTPTMIDVDEVAGEA